MIKKIYARNSISQLLRLQSGFSLVELMVAIALGIFLVLGVTNILFSGQQSFNATNRIARVQENGQLAKNMLIDDLKRARYMGANARLASLAGTAAAIDPAATCNNDDNTWGRMIKQGVFGIDDNQIRDDGVTYECITRIDDDDRGGYRPDTDILTVRYAAPWKSDVSDPNDPINDTSNADRLYIRSALRASWIFTGKDANDMTLNSDETGLSGSGERIKSTHELIAYSYYIGNSDRQCSGEVIPSLFRVSLGANGKPVTEELIPGIEDFQVQFSTDGTTYQDAHAITDWDAVVATQIWLLARSECEEGGHNDSEPYRLADEADYIPNNGNGDGYRRQLYSSIISHRNSVNY